MLKPATQTRAAFELAFAGMLWGFGFVAAVWALRGMGPLSITGWRFVVASIVGIAIARMMPSQQRQSTWEQFLLALVPGLLISLTLVLQTWALRFTTATKCGFITTLYVIIVPLLEWWWLKRRPQKLHFFCVVIGLIGMVMIADLPSEFSGHEARSTEELRKQRVNIGDLLTFLCAVAASVHIVWFGLIQSKIRSSFVFNNYQSVWAAMVPLGLSYFYEPAPQLAVTDLSIFGFLSLAIGSTLIAFALQVRAQKIISPSLASLLFLLESPFATLFAFLILGERLQNIQWLGAGFILVAAALASRASRPAV